jgi:protein SCO1/2
MNRGRTNLLVAVLLTLVLYSRQGHAQQHYPASGLVLSVDLSQKTMVVSCDEIQGFMDAMVMPFKVQDAKVLDHIARGSLIDFILVVNKEASYAEKIRIRGYASAEREPSKSRRLQGLSEDLRGPMHRLAVGQSVPDFILTDQKKRPVRLSQFAGKVVALNFVYTRCALPEYCFRSSNNFGILQKRYPERLGRDLVLLSVTFDPVHDQPGVLQSWANTWKADPESWRFLTGAAADVQRVCDLFGVHFVPDEGLFIHSLHTAIIGRDGKLVVDLEGNGFTGQQLGDLVKTVLDTGKK